MAATRPTHHPPTSDPASPIDGPLGVKTEPSCKTCNSRHRGEIETRLLGGQSTRSVSAWLEATHGEVIRYDALLRHKKAHINPGLEAARQIQAARTGAAKNQPAQKAAPAAKPARAAGGKPAKGKEAKPPPGVAPAYAAEVVETIADVSLIDLLAQEALATMRSVATAIQSGGGEASFAQSALLVGMTRELVKATQARHIILTGKSTGAGARAKAQDAIGGLKAIIANGPPPAIEGDDPDDADEDESGDGLIGDPVGDLTREPRWADGEPDTDPDREVVDAPAQDAVAAAAGAVERVNEKLADAANAVATRLVQELEKTTPAASGTPRTWLWQPPRPR
jgi:hypothetical protein